MSPKAAMVAACLRVAHIAIDFWLEQAAPTQAEALLRAWLASGTLDPWVVYPVAGRLNRLAETTINDAETSEPPDFTAYTAAESALCLEAALRALIDEGEGDVDTAFVYARGTFFLRSIAERRNTAAAEAAAEQERARQEADLRA